MSMMDAVIQFRNTIYEGGYGLIASSVMRDKTLPKQSRLIYAYMCSFASFSGDGKRSAFPSVSLQCAELDMTEDTYYKWRKPLEKRGFITIEKRKNGTKFERNVYFIEPTPKPLEEKKPEKSTIEPSPKNSGMEKKPYPNSSGTKKSSPRNSGTNSISSNIINPNKDINLVNKESLVSIINDYYSTFASGRWSKEQWKTITNQLSEELLDEDGFFTKASDPYSYVNGCLKKIAHHHDMKTGKKVFTYQGTKIPFYDWLSQ
jgi:hypothetical protein